MNVKDTIDLAVEVLGSQRELARLSGMPEQHISGFKNGRPCSAEKHAQIAYAAGLITRGRHILLDSVLEASRNAMPNDEDLRRQLHAIVDALPEEETTITPAPRKKGASARGVATDKSRLRKTLRT